MKTLSGFLALLLIALLSSALPAQSKAIPPTGKQVTPKQSPKLDRNGDPLPKGAIARMGTLALRPSIPRLMAAISPDGSMVATIGHGQHSIHLWNVLTGNETGLIELTEKKPIYQWGLGFSPRGKFLALSVTPKEDEKKEVIHIWNVKEKKPICSFSSFKREFAFSPDERSFLFQNSKTTLGVYEIPSGRLVQTVKLKKDDYFWNLSFSDDGTRIAADYSNLLKIWRFKDGQQLLNASISIRIPKKKHPISPKFGPDAERTWNWNNLITGKKSKFLSVGEGFIPVVKTEISPDFKKFAILGYREIFIIDVNTGKKLLTIKKGFSDYVDFSFSRDSRYLALESENTPNTIEQIDLKTGKVKSVFRGHKTRLEELRFSENGKWMLGYSETRYYVWNTSTRKLLPVFNGHDYVTRISFSTDGRRLVSMGNRYLAKVISKHRAIHYHDTLLWNSETGQLIADCGESSGTIFLSNRESLGIWQQDGELRLYDIETGQKQKKYLMKTWDGKSPKWGMGAFGAIPFDLAIRSLHHSRTSSNLTYLIDNWNIFSWDYKQNRYRFMDPTNVPLIESGDAEVDEIYATSDQKLILAKLEVNSNFIWDERDKRDRLLLLDSDSGKVKHAIKPKFVSIRITKVAKKSPYMVLWTEPEKSSIARLEVWNYLSNERIQSFDVLSYLDRPQSDSSFFADPALEISADGSMIAVGEDSNVVIWSVKSGKKLATLEGHKGLVTALDFSSDGKRLASGSIDSTILIWDLETILKSKKPK